MKCYSRYWTGSKATAKDIFSHFDTNGSPGHMSSPALMQSKLTQNPVLPLGCMLGQNSTEAITNVKRITMWLQLAPPQDSIGMTDVIQLPGRVLTSPLFASGPLQSPTESTHSKIGCFGDKHLQDNSKLGIALETSLYCLLNYVNDSGFVYRSHETLLFEAFESLVTLPFFFLSP